MEKPASDKPASERAANEERSQRADATGPRRFRDRQPGASLLRIAFYIFIARTTLLLGKLLFGLAARDVSNVPSTGPVLLAANHQSYLDPPFIGCLIRARNLDYIARVGLFWGPLGWLISALSAIPIRGSGADKGTIREVANRLKMGRGTLIFPEGSRTEDGKLGPFSAGVLMLAKLSDAPVVPVAITGAYKAWPRSRAFPTPWKARVIVQYGRPIAAKELLALGSDAAMARLQQEIEALLRELGDEGVVAESASRAAKVQGTGETPVLPAEGTGETPVLPAEKTGETPVPPGRPRSSS
jgi:1-acyl-sn-glycerol-3-phosphate acyltransferase